MYCRNCGNELVGTPEICLGCGARPVVGSNFCHACGARTNPLAEMCVTCGSRLTRVLAGDTSPKSRLATALLAFFIGEFGAHRFYIGKIGTAVLMLILGIIGWSTIWIMGIGLIFLIPVSIWSLIDFILALAGTLKDGGGKPIQNW